MITNKNLNLVLKINPLKDESINKMELKDIHNNFVDICDTSTIF